MTPIGYLLATLCAMVATVVLGINFDDAHRNGDAVMAVIDGIAGLGTGGIAGLCVYLAFTDDRA